MYCEIYILERSSSPSSNQMWILPPSSNLRARTSELRGRIISFLEFSILIPGLRDSTSLNFQTLGIGGQFCLPLSFASNPFREFDGAKNAGIYGLDKHGNRSERDCSILFKNPLPLIGWCVSPRRFSWDLVTKLNAMQLKFYIDVWPSILAEAWIDDPRSPIEQNKLRFCRGQQSSL